MHPQCPRGICLLSHILIVWDMPDGKFQNLPLQGPNGRGCAIRISDQMHVITTRPMHARLWAHVTCMHMARAHTCWPGVRFLVNRLRRGIGWVRGLQVTCDPLKHLSGIMPRFYLHAISGPPNCQGSLAASTVHRTHSPRNGTLFAALGACVIRRGHADSSGGMLTHQGTC